ncbi:MAG TPA: AMP-binding protein [Bryobacteraceae bacterium]|nr:AMP-binding protein [Bryobacteraceae bacterium]
MEQAIGIQEIGAATGNLARLELENLERFGVYTRLYFEDRSYTNADELRYAGSLARVLEGYGVRRGDRVLVMMPNLPELTAAFQAIWTIGAVVTPVIPQWTPGEVANILRSAEPAVALTVPPLAARLDQANADIKTLKQLLVFGECDVKGSVNISGSIQGAPPIETPVDSVPSDLAVLLYTSGTTGTPKGVMLTHGNMAAAWDSAYSQNPDLERGVMLNGLPLTHVYGILAQNMANRWGWSTVLMKQFDPTRALEAIERYQVKYVPAVPTMLMYLMGHPERERRNLTSLSRIISGGAALPEQLRQQAERIFHCRIEQGYGLSESASVATGYELKEPYRPGSVGEACPGVEIRILDEQSRPLPPRSNGEICLKGPNIMAGYWRDPAATRDAIQEGWFHTGDIGFLDEDGYLYITDRKKDLIIKGGENISPREIEDVFYRHPAVAEAAVVGVPDRVYGEEIYAVLQLRTGVEISAEELQVYVGQFVTKFKVPARIILQPLLPKNVIGKILKYKIRAELLSQLGGQ